jgi:hypothetical protein
VAKLSVDRGSAEAVQASNQLEEQLRQLAVVELDPFWKAVGDALHQIAAGNRNWRSLYETASRWEEGGETQLGIVYRTAAMIDAAPREAFNLTMYTFQRQLIPWLGDTPYETVVIPFLRGYWQRAFAQCPFYFSAPARTAKELADAFSLPGDRGLRSALKVIARSLGIVVAGEQKEYLSALEH